MEFVSDFLRNLGAICLAVVVVGTWMAFKWKKLVEPFNKAHIDALNKLNEKIRSGRLK